MTTPTIIGAGIAFALIALAIAALIWVVRLMRRPTRRAAAPNPAVEPPTAPASAVQAASPPIPPSTPALAPSLPYARIAHLLSPAEGDFFAALQAAAPAGMLLFAQVRLANLVEVQRWARGDKSHWWRIQAKCVCFPIIVTAECTDIVVGPHASL